MPQIELSISESLLAALRKTPIEVAAEIRLAASIHWYQQGALSMERAAKTAGLSRAGVLAELARPRVDVLSLHAAELVREARDA